MPKSWKASILTIFPEMFPGPLGCSNVGKALEKGLWELETLNIRDFAEDKHATVDDRPFGGGAGMVMRPDILGKALDHALAHASGTPRIIYPSPRGRVLDQACVEEMITHSHIMVICGRYEGIDQRVLDHYAVEEISLGDFILSGGEIASMALIDACVRRLPGVLSNALSCEQESFGHGAFGNLLEYPHFTRPATWQGQTVPEVLLSGDHAAVEAWRKAQSEALTQERRKDLWEEYIRATTRET
ncbi:MAG: tRNA (guanosine(37)-N1)-methyltransferase TrmD [Hyphomicrobiales bacterium]|nr:tRNA (guanosine(37)-N1)-methyltransferase TrmD [Hyphomicrobiales bacterium]